MIPHNKAVDILCVDNRTYRDWGKEGYFDVSIEGIDPAKLSFLWFTKIQPVLVTAKKNPALAYEKAQKMGYDIPGLIPNEDNILDAQTMPVELKPIVKEVVLDSWDEEELIWKPEKKDETTHHASGRKRRSDAGKKRKPYGPRKNKKA